MNKMIDQIFGSNLRRKKRANPSYTCSKLEQVGKGVIALDETKLANIPSSEFGYCTLLLGAITKWSSNQLSSLANLALQVIIFGILKKIFNL
jgi:hypothetical protein